MSQARPAPNMNAAGRLFLEHAPGFDLRLIGASEGNHQIQLRATVEHITDATQYAIHLPEAAKAVEVHCGNRGGLEHQFFVVHGHPRPKARKTYIATVDFVTEEFSERKFPLRCKTRANNSATPGIIAERRT